jgi:5S rRNA maturation endonuclease (ribonuclease M5)
MITGLTKVRKMYLKNIFIENMGSIKKISLVENQLIKNDHTPRVIVLVGENGTGKTTFLSSIVDAFYQLGQDCFEDVLPKDGAGYKYFKISGATNKRLNTEHGFSYIQFSIAPHGKKYEYIDKNGQLTLQECTNKTNGLLTLNQNWQDNNNFKHNTKTKNDSNFIQDFEANSYCYFPSDRFEYPYWINKETVKTQEQFTDYTNFTGQLNKSILLRNTLSDLKSWILDIFLDTLYMHEVNIDNDQKQSISIFQISLFNIENILSEVLTRKVKLKLNLRNHLNSRLKIIDAETGEDILPSLDSLSAGQSSLLSIFLNITKNSDKHDLNKSLSLNLIEGVVIIDEIDLHLHIELQNNILPKLIKLFPKVQFILTSHSPFFLNGMAREFSENDYIILNMPSGEILDCFDNFEEFNKAYDVLYKITSNYKHERDLIKAELNKSREPIIITEGKTDKKIIETAWKKIYQENIIPFRIIPSGLESDEDKREGSADNARRTTELISNILDNDRILIVLFDNDREGNEQFKGLNKKIFEPYRINNIKRKHSTKRIHGLLLPVPQHREAFVTNNDITQRYFVIEHYFSDEILNNNNMKGDYILGSKVFKINGDKDKFSENISTLEENNFDEFKILFDEIKTIIND